MYPLLEDRLAMEMDDLFQLADQIRSKKDDLSQLVERTQSKRAREKWFVQKKIKEIISFQGVVRIELWAN